MKQLNNTKSEVFLSTYDNSDLLLPVSEEYKNNDNICVAVKFGDVLIKISPKNTCKCTWDEAVNEHREELINPVYWQIVGNVYHEVNQAIEMLGHDPLDWIWTDTEDNDPQCSGDNAWCYGGPYGGMSANLKGISRSVRVSLAFQL